MPPKRFVHTSSVCFCCTAAERKLKEQKEKERKEAEKRKKFRDQALVGGIFPCANA